MSLSSTFAALVWTLAGAPVSGTTPPDTARVFFDPIAIQSVVSDSVVRLDTLGRLPATRVAASIADSLEPSPQDTVRRRRAAVTYSEGYGNRVVIHRRLSYAMLPLFALSYFSGDQLFKSGPNAPAWARKLHGPSATSVGVLFGTNVVLGSMNLWEGRHDRTERKRKIIHAALFMASSAGFTYSGAVLAEKAEVSITKRRQHRALNLSSMGVATLGWTIMLVGR